MSSNRVCVPTDREAAILRVLWADGPLPVSEILERFNDLYEPEISYRSVQSTLSRMRQKDYVELDRGGYAATLSQEYARKLIVRRVIDDYFDGSSAWAVEWLRREAEREGG